MMKTCLPALLLMLAVCAPCVALAAADAVPDKPMTAENFRLLDHNGKSHELYRYSDAKAIVLYWQGNGCPIVRQSFPKLKRIRASYKSKDVQFFMINSNPQDDRASVAEEMGEYGVRWPVLLDEAQIVARAYGVARTAEAFVITPGDWKIHYRGPVDDRFDYGARRPEAKEDYLSDALDAVLEGKAIETPVRDPKGCKINLLDPADLSFSTAVAPILINKCTPCHRKGDVAPFALDSHKRASGWADMIREVVLTDRMPPWYADPHIGEFSNDRGLTPEERRVLVAWADAGAPADPGGVDPLATHDPGTPSEWALGNPDAVVGMPDPFGVPVDGELDYQMIEVPTNFDEDKWVRATEVKPGNPEVVHHALVFIEYPKGMEDIEPGVSGGTRGFFGGFVPGVTPHFYPEGTGKWIPKGSKFIFQMHYVTNGKAQSDQTHMALHFCKEKPKERIVTKAAYTSGFEIPPGVREFRVRDGHTIRTPVTLYGMSPHMHYRGARMEYTAVYPDGTREPLLSVPNYNFDWQSMYYLKHPKKLPRGTEIVVTGAFDNSPTNPYNPDPTQTVHFGEQTWDEMFIGYLEYSAPVGKFVAMRKRNAKWDEREREEFKREHAELFEQPKLTEEQLIGTLWSEGEWKFRYKADGKFLVNELISGQWRIEDDKVIMDVAGEHFELDIIGSGLFFDGSYPIDRLE